MYPSGTHLPTLLSLNFFSSGGDRHSTKLVSDDESAKDPEVLLSMLFSLFRS